MAQRDGIDDVTVEVDKGKVKFVISSRYSECGSSLGGGSSTDLPREQFKDPEAGKPPGIAAASYRAPRSSSKGEAEKACGGSSQILLVSSLRILRLESFRASPPLAIVHLVRQARMKQRNQRK